MRMITQRDFKDCGVTCMEYIIKFYHGYIPIEKLREDTFTSQEGTTAFHIVETFKKYNFDSFGKKITFFLFKQSIFTCYCSYCFA